MVLHLLVSLSSCSDVHLDEVNGLAEILLLDYVLDDISTIFRQIVIILKHKCTFIDQTFCVLEAVLFYSSMSMRAIQLFCIVEGPASLCHDVLGYSCCVLGRVNLPAHCLYRSFDRRIR
jgi:hypothetical protein